MSEQPATMMLSPTTAATARAAGMSLQRRMVLPLWQVKHVAHWALAKLCLATTVLSPRDFRLAEQKEVDVVGRQRIIERRSDDVAWPGRLHNVRRYDDDEIGFILLIGLARK